YDREHPPGQTALVHVVDHGRELLQGIGLGDELVGHELAGQVELDKRWDVAVGLGRAVAAADDAPVHVGEVGDLDVGELGVGRGHADDHAGPAPVEGLDRVGDHRRV